MDRDVSRSARSASTRMLAVTILAAVAACDAGAPADGSGGPPVPVPAPPHVPAVPAAVAIVFHGQELWIGNEEHEPDENAVYKGALHTLRLALDQHPPARALPPGSQGTLITYDSEVRTLVPMGPVDRIGGAALGTQRDYRGRIGASLVKAIVVAAGELVGIEATHRMLVVFGDGDDISHERLRDAVPTIRELLELEHIELVGIVWKDATCCFDGCADHPLFGNGARLRYLDDLPDRLAAAWATMTPISARPR